jgi:hypothetical protein
VPGEIDAAVITIPAKIMPEVVECGKRVKGDHHHLWISELANVI